MQAMEQAKVALMQYKILRRGFWLPDLGMAQGWPACGCGALHGIRLRLRHNLASVEGRVRAAGGGICDCSSSLPHIAPDGHLGCRSPC